MTKAIPNVSLQAVKMLGDMLAETEERIIDAGVDTDDQLKIDLKAANELWELYQILLNQY